MTEMSRNFSGAKSEPFAPSFDAGVIERLGGMENATAAPAAEMPAHPFLCVEGNSFCGKCGGGVLHQVHAAKERS